MFSARLGSRGEDKAKLGYYTLRAGGPSFLDVAKVWEPLLLADAILASASSPVHLGLGGGGGDRNCISKK
jgi:hypothetical protein